MTPSFIVSYQHQITTYSHDDPRFWRNLNYVVTLWSFKVMLHGTIYNVTSLRWKLLSPNITHENFLRKQFVRQHTASFFYFYFLSVFKTFATRSPQGNVPLRVVRTLSCFKNHREKLSRVNSSLLFRRLCVLHFKINVLFLFVSTRLETPPEMLLFRMDLKSLQNNWLLQAVMALGYVAKLWLLVVPKLSNTWLKIENLFYQMRNRID